MNAEIHELPQRPGHLAAPQLRTLVVCDIADSTALVERMGDQNAANIIRKHDRLSRALVEQHRGREIDKTDGFLLLFDRPIQAVAFALDYQRGLKHLSAAEGVVLRARVGIHMGDVVIWENAAEDVARGAKPIEVEGLVKPVAARLAQLALPQQILSSSAAAGIAHRAQGELGGDAAKRVHWKEHGRYRFKGLPEALEVVEIGEDKIAPMRAPHSGRTAKKILPWYRRPLTLAAEAAVLAIAIGIGAWLVLQSPPTLAFAARDWVVVGDVQNHTNQKQLDDSLNAAIRIGLEQSRYVNIVPDMEAEATLKRMEKPPTTSIDRATGAEIAMRDGARALILPSLAQVGGRIQLSAEVIDPNTGVTVYSDSAQADGENGILPATDKLLGKLRGRLGESLASIQKTSMPLAQITTGNLDALRAYGEALQAYGRGDVNAYFSLLKEALRLDPTFAAAWMRLGASQLFALNDPRSAYASLMEANARRNRLSMREKLELDGTLARFGNLADFISAWTAAARLYPDDPGPQQNLGMALLLYEHKLKTAIPHFEMVTHSHHPMRGLSWYNLAAIETELGDYSKAQADVAQGRKLGAFTPHFEDVATDLAQRKYVAVLARLDAAPASLPPSIQAEKQVRYAAVALDQGNDDKARLYLDKAAADAALTPSRAQRARIELARTALALAMKQAGASEELAHLISNEGERSQEKGPATDDTSAIHLALAAMLAARSGEIPLADKALEDSRGMALDHGYYDRAALWNTAHCEAQFADSSSQRIACLLKLVDGREYFQTHVALWLAYRDIGDKANVSAQARWLVSHRGQALAELDNEPALIPNLLALRYIPRGQ